MTQKDWIDFLKEMSQEAKPCKDVIENLSCEIEHHITHDVKNSLEEFLSKYLDG